MVKDSVYKICTVPTALHKSGARICYGLKSVGINKIEPRALKPFSTLITLGTLHTHTPHSNSILQRRTHRHTGIIAPLNSCTKRILKISHLQQRGVASTYTATTDFNPLLDGK